jgi:ribosomal-protein-serine acetyltransferase
VNPIRWDLGEGLVVRTYVMDDAAELFALVDVNRDRLRPWMFWEPHTRSPDDSRTFIQRCLSSDDYEGNGLWLDGRLIGGMGLTLDLPVNSAEIGYWIDGAYEGRGIVTRAATRFLGLAFDELGLHRVELQAAVENVRSRAVAQRLGMIEEGIARDGGRVSDGYQDLVRYAILEDEWRARRVRA